MGEPVIAVLISVIITPIIAFIISQVGVTRKTKEIEYNLKRLELVEKMKRLKSSLNDTIRQKHDWTILDIEIEDILYFLDDTSTKETEREHNRYQSKSRIRRIFILPKPQTIGGWIATIIYYFYGVGGTLTYLIMFILSLFIDISMTPELEPNLPETEKIVYLSGMIGCITIAVVSRYFAIRSAKKATTHEKKVSQSAD